MFAIIVPPITAVSNVIVEGPKRLEPQTQIIAVMNNSETYT